MRRITPRLVGVVLVTVALVCCAGLVLTLALVPSAGPVGADMLRKVAGDAFVARLESAVYTTRDKIDQEEFALGIKQESAPWEVEPTPKLRPTVTPFPVHEPVAGQTAVPQPTQPPPEFRLESLKPFTKKAGEGIWQPYIFDAAGRTVAYRTFLSPDPVRPYVSMGLVAFDLRAARLEFVLGTQEPVNHNNAPIPARTGKIPDLDAKPGKLLAVFNGGFKTQHGNFGVGVNSNTLVPARDGFMTVGQPKSGSLKMGAWSSTLAGTEWKWWRQNGPPIIQSGQINPLTENNAAGNWGAALDGSVAVWRSAMATNKDSSVLFYAAGDSLLVSTMARALITAGAQDAMQLDINNFWVHFDAIKADGDKLATEPLFDGMKAQDDRRYLNGYTRDYFYVVSK